MAVTDAATTETAQKGEGPFDLLIRLGAVMGALTAALTAFQGVLDALRSREIASLLPLLIGVLIVLALVAAISGLTWLARRSRSAVVGFVATLVLAMVTTVLGLALAASALPHLGYQLALQRVPQPVEVVAAARESAPLTPEAPVDEAPIPEAAAPTEDVVVPPAAAGGAAPAEDPYERCAAEAQSAAATYAAMEEALVACLART